jgi:DNA-binding MarR family transcriptional regulator
MPDHVAAILEAWRSEQPQLDVSPVAVFGRIARIERHLGQALAPLYRSRGIESGDYDVLAALRRSGPPYGLTPTQLYRSLLVTSATMTERLDRLEQRKLIRRLPAPDDRRSVLVELTKRGRALFDKAHADLLAIEASLLEGLTANERTTLADLLARLAGALEEGSSGA